MIFRLLMVSALMMLGFSGYSQLVQPTTEEEYNYGAIGYRIQLQTRMPDKPGYEVRENGICEEPGRKITLLGMYRSKEIVPCASILIYDRSGAAPQYYCVPSSNASPKLWDQFQKSLTGGTDKPAEQMQFFSTCLARFMMEQSTKSNSVK